MKRLALLAIVLVLATLAGCNTMPGEDPGYHVHATPQIDRAVA